MLSFLVLAIIGLSIARIAQLYTNYQKNVNAVKASGLPYISIPIYTFNPAWLLIHTFFMPLVKFIPEAKRPGWINYLTPEYVWLEKFEPFRKSGSDIMFVVSPGRTTLLVANAEAISQITTRRNDFPKPIELYRGVDIYGKNVVSTEGSIWRHHRKITSAPFTEKNNKLVWTESLHQVQSMMNECVGPGNSSSKTLYNVNDQTMRLSLHVISRAGFGVKLLWPHEEKEVVIPEGHTLTYKDALTTLLHNLLVLLLTPKWFLPISPFKIHKTTNEAFVEWGKYMREMFETKRAEVAAGKATDGMDLMGALVKGSGITEGSSTEKRSGDSEKQAGAMFADDEILGNAFVFILAGHETAANTIHFSCLLLAMRPSSQRRLQEDLDKLLGDRPASEWTYEKDLPELFANMCGAVMNEQLRCIAPVTGIPKSTLMGSPQGLQIDGKPHLIPEHVYITLSTAGVHRNPKYWPHTSPEDLDDFRPERWILDPQVRDSQGEQADAYTTEAGLDFEGPDKRPDTAADLFRPIRGSYIPFSEGYRSCLGRRFAQVEILAVLAFIFKHYSVELDVTPYLSDEEFAQATQAVKETAWFKARDRAKVLLDRHMMTIITIMLRKERPPLRFVRRGHEQFPFIKV